MTGGRIVDDADGAFDNVVDVGEIPDHVSTVENLDGLSMGNRCREEHRRHVRTPPGTIDSEETQTRGRNPVELGIGVSHQLIGLLRRPIETHLTVRLILLAERDLGVEPID